VAALDSGPRTRFYTRRMKCWFHILLLVLLAAPGRAQSGPAAAYFPLWQAQAPNITDLALIYQGGLQRPHWTTNYFAPYVSYRDPQDGKEQWLFDGFLFLEFADGRGHTYEPGRRLKPATQADWLWLLERNFAPDDGIPQLEAACRDMAARLGKPLRPRQVLITVPEPIAGQTNWGIVAGRALDFHRAADRVAACQWFLDTALAKWQALAPQHLELAGFYWLHESAPRTGDLVPAVAKLVHERHKQFCWIPYWHNSTLAGNWRAYGFDVAWQQPNHFFHPELPDSRLQAACAFGRTHGMGMEMEFDERLLSRPEVFAPRFNAYLDSFTTNSVKDTASIAYYEGGGAWFELANSKEPEPRRHYDRLAHFIRERQQRADQQARR
jgi:hypothetical protein